MWATTYDFTPRDGSNKLQPKIPPPLPDALWKRLIERYNDPDEKVPYAEAKGEQTKLLGTLKDPGGLLDRF